MEAGDEISRKQRSSSVSPPRDPVNTGECPGQEGEDSLSMKPGVPSASPPQESQKVPGGWRTSLYGAEALNSFPPKTPREESGPWR